MPGTPFDFQGVVASKHWLSPDTISLVVQLQQPTSMKFLAGQFVNIQAGDKLFRPYSIASAPSQSRELEFAIKLVEGGKASGFFTQLAPGTVILLKGPFGKFVLSDELDRPDQRNRFMFVASGTGLAPILSHIKTLFEAQNPLPKTLYFGFYDSSRYLYQDMLEGWEKNHPEFKVVPVVSDQPAGVAWEGRRGFLNTILEQEIQEVTGLDAYVCGNPKMVQAVKPVLLAKGLSAQHIHEERF